MVPQIVAPRRQHRVSLMITNGSSRPDRFGY
jgi:hypothetical protein